MSSKKQRPQGDHVTHWAHSDNRQSHCGFDRQYNVNPNPHRHHSGGWHLLLLHTRKWGHRQRGLVEGNKVVKRFFFQSQNKQFPDLLPPPTKNEYTILVTHQLYFMLTLHKLIKAECRNVGEEQNLLNLFRLEANSSSPPLYHITFSSVPEPANTTFSW